MEEKREFICTANFTTGDGGYKPGDRVELTFKEAVQLASRARVRFPVEGVRAQVAAFAGRTDASDYERNLYYAERRRAIKLVVDWMLLPLMPDLLPRFSLEIDMLDFGLILKEGERPSVAKLGFFFVIPSVLNHDTTNYIRLRLVTVEGTEFEVDVANEQAWERVAEMTHEYLEIQVT